MGQPLRRSVDNYVLGGVLGGIAEHFDLNPTGLRFVYAAASILSAAFPGVLVYVVLWLLIPRRQ